MDNMKVWDAVKQPPKSALKQITGGRLKGMTDVNPQWRYQVMTEQFGVCGIGWKYEITRVWQEPLSDGQVFAFAEVSVYTGIGEGDDKMWSDPIPGIGGSMLVAKEASGLHANDEAYKMAITDALSVAMKMLGVAGDVYAGLWDGTKYVEPSSTPTKSTPVAVKKPTSTLSPQQLYEAAQGMGSGVALCNFAKLQGYTNETLKTTLGVSKPSDIKNVQVAAVVLFPKPNSLVEEALKLGAKEIKEE